MEKAQNHFDAIVVGAGIGGLVSARELSHAGLSTLLVEARDRVGGRTNTVDFAGLRIESGGTFFDLEREPDIVEEFQRYNIPTRYTKGDIVYRTLLNGKVYESAFPFEQVDDLIKVVYQAIHDSHRIDMDLENWVSGLEDLDIPFSEWLDQFDIPEETREYACAWIELYAGNLTTEVSALNILGPYIAGVGHSPWSWYAGVSYEIEGGSTVYQQALLDDSPGLKVKLSTPIDRVEQNADRVTLTARDGEAYTADQVVWATPLNTWANVDFVPPLSEAKQGAAKNRHIGRHHKLWMRVRNVPVGLYAVSSESPFKLMVHHAELENGETVIFAMTEDSQLDIDDRAGVLAELRRIVPEADLLDTFYENWIDSEFSQGTWMVAPPGFLTSYLTDLDRPEGRLHFAGADVNSRWLSWMVGAVVSAKKAATALVAARR